jgi:deferrochelatase/peroxidase EfeB
MTGLTRRQLLGLAGAAAVGGVALGPGRAASSPSQVVPFGGHHQAGIDTAPQSSLLFASFDLVTTRRADLVALLRDWTVAADRLTRGQPVAGPSAAAGAAVSTLAPPADTGEAAGLPPARLTLTFGFGPTLFDGRFGLASRRPPALVELPVFAGEVLDPARCGGDLCVQACADDPQVLFHAIRNLTRMGRGAVVLRWVQEGFASPRNLMGFKDGTANPRPGTPVLDDNVWVTGADGPSWMVGGSYLVARRIRIRIETWDRSSLDDQEQTIGRHRDTGAPLGRTHEFDPVDLTALPKDAHVAVASQAATGIHFLRRGYNFSDGVDPKVGQLDAGLFFLAYQRDPRRQFIPLQQRLAASDALNEYIRHDGSAVFAIPPGVRPSGWIGAPLLFS